MELVSNSSRIFPYYKSSDKRYKEFKEKLNMIIWTCSSDIDKKILKSTQYTALTVGHISCGQCK